VRKYYFSLLILLLIITACQEERIPVPKPRMYPKVTYPERNYVSFDKDYCAFHFKHPDYMVFQQDTTLVNQSAKHACWFTMGIPSLNGSVHFTYTDISGDSSDYKLFDAIRDSYELTEKHNRKATGRDEFPFEVPQKDIFGIRYRVEGDVASPYHFILTDSTHHAVWASLYFNTRPNADSLRPVIDFVAEDLNKVIETFEWDTADK